MQEDIFENAKLLDITIEPLEEEKETLRTNIGSDDMEIRTYPFLYLYIDAPTKKHIEFSLEGARSDMSVEEAIEHFFREVDRFGKDASALSKELTSQLESEELDIFILAPYSKKHREALEKKIFIVREDERYYDRYGFEYIVEAVGYEYAFLGYEQPDGDYKVFYVDAKTLDHPGSILQSVGERE